MSTRRALTAFAQWWVEPAPRWSLVVGAPLVVVLVSLVAWDLVGGDGTPAWVPAAANVIVLWGLIPVVVGGWIHAYVRTYRREGQQAG
ncbi:hypothetical protein [Demequina activiva]|uniref:Uncharacterized protein n=1 Tax=Demequina activiva TaxID=1582364 RepID=A0A919Q0W3_9MICO|nr:hypothetical protein [Demequina activiva]GIG53974.1 hypothetical protein Dac01nite_07260 [Demequina activiva]